MGSTGVEVTMLDGNSEQIHVVPESEQLRVQFVVSGLGVGGAETNLLELMVRLRRVGVRVAVIAIGSASEALPRFAAQGLEVHRSDFDLRPIGGFAQSIQRVRAFRPDVIQGWMYHGNIAASLLSRALSPRPALSWGIRHSLGREQESRMTRVAISMHRWRSFAPDALVFNSECGRETHEKLRVRAKRLIVIHNGVDADRFTSSPSARAALRSRFGIRDHEVVFGYVGRNHSIKGLSTLIEAFQRSCDSRADLRLMLVGKDMYETNHELTKALVHRGIRGRTILLGSCEQMERTYPAFDCLVLPSYGEGTSNVVLEAMASEVPCIVTDVGDNALLIDTRDYVVPARNSDLLAQAILSVACRPETERRKIGAQLRRRAEMEFSPERMARSYHDLYRALVGTPLVS